MQKQNKLITNRSIIWSAIMGLAFSVGSTNIAAQPNTQKQQVTVTVNPDKSEKSESKQDVMKNADNVQQQNNTSPVLNIGSQTNNDLAEYSRLSAEKRKLELLKDIAKLKKEKEEIELGVKSEKQNEKDAQIQMLQMQLSSKAAVPSQAQLLYDSVTVLAIFGSGTDMAAKIYTDNGIMSAEVGSKLPTGEVVQSIKDGGVMLIKGKSSRRLTPTAEKPLPLTDKASQPGAYPGSPPANATSQVSGTSPFSGPPPQYIPPFDPAELMGKPTSVKTAPANGQQSQGL
jgi:hypothetical protein